MSATDAPRVYCPACDEGKTAGHIDGCVAVIYSSHVSIAPAQGTIARPPTCGQNHNGFQTCRGPEDGCFALEGDYATDARYVYPEREAWFRAAGASREEELAAANKRLTDTHTRWLEATADVRTLEAWLERSKSEVAARDRRIEELEGKARTVVKVNRDHPVNRFTLSKAVADLAAALSKDTPEPTASPRETTPTLMPGTRTGYCLDGNHKKCDCEPWECWCECHKKPAPEDKP